MRKHHFVFLGIFYLSLQNLQAQSILKDFSGRQTSQHTIYLEWTTKAGSTCADLSIERSFEGGVFEEVYQYNGICGETDKDQTYSYIDSITQGGMYGYRINENNGDYSDTIFVQAFADGAAVVAYPNPAGDVIYLRFSDYALTKINYMLVNQQGHVLRNVQNEHLQNGISLSTLPAGIYNLIVYQSNNPAISMRVIRMN
ncbi:MAG: T9SS type A sorting domain-containing protein [Bacteroidia bacterium]|jgi:hypothetical protein